MAFEGASGTAAIFFDLGADFARRRTPAGKSVQANGNTPPAFVRSPPSMR
jgi:hypothetical protein